MTMTKELLQILFVRSTVLPRAAVAMAVRQNLAKATITQERGLGRSLMIVVAILKSRHLRGPITYILSLWQQRGDRDDRNDDGQQRNCSSNQNYPDYSDNGYSNQYRNQSRNNSDDDNRQYNSNSVSNSNFQNDQ